MAAKRQNIRGQHMLATKPKQQQKEKPKPNIGGTSPLKQNAKVGPNRRAQAVLRRAEAPKKSRTETSAIWGDADSRGRVRKATEKITNTEIKNPGVGLEVSKETRQINKNPSISELAFFRNGKLLKPSDQRRGKLNPPPVKKTGQGLEKDRIRAAALRHGLGRQLQDIRPGHKVEAYPTTPSRKRAYESGTNKALSGNGVGVSGQKLTTHTWKNAKGEIRNFDPERMKDGLRALAQTNSVRAVTKLAGGTVAGKVAQGALMANDALKVTTGKDFGDVKRRLERENIRQSTEDIRKRKQTKLPPNAAF